MSDPSIVIRPVQLRSPVIASASSACPLPATAAIPTISPAWTSSDTSRRAGRPRSLSAETPLTDRTTRPRSTGARSSTSRTGRPTMSPARSARVVPSGSTSDAVTRPARMTVIRSAMARTSPSLWLMKTTLLPAAVIARSVTNSSSASWGARTAVGSSMIRIRAPRWSILRISTRCCSPTESCQTWARGSTCSPSSCAIPSTSASVLRRSSLKRGRSMPRSTFSATVCDGTNAKC